VRKSADRPNSCVIVKSRGAFSFGQEVVVHPSAENLAGTPSGAGALSEALVDDLTSLSNALDDPLADLFSVLSVLTGDLAAIPLFLGLTVALLIDGNLFSFSTLEKTSPVAVHSSVALTLLPLDDRAASGSLAFFSGAGGALNELAESARWIFNLDGAPVLDQHLDQRPARSPGPG
jgi:hypothetical protein